ncbi:MAG: O-methyltransferase [Bacteroidota bacterium]|jgi:predicted O-methyltransferase YrrM|nr:O-methyltransferase [Bacteroidota bacterium]
MEFIDKAIEDYSLLHSQPESDILKKINRETHAKVMQPRMLSGHMQGNFLSMISQMIKPSCVLEIGTYTGYSAICLASGLTTEGRLYTLDVNEELENTVNSFFKEAGLHEKIKHIVGDAMKLIPQINEKFDIVFIDADKKNYSNYYDLVFDKVRPGGFIIADNVLWSGKILDLNTNRDTDTLLIDAFNKKVHSDKRVEKMLLPLRDGLMIARKL